MSSIPFDTYRLINKLKEQGFSETQASGIAAAIQEIDLSEVATTSYIERLRSDLLAALRELVEIGVQNGPTPGLKSAWKMDPP